MHSLQPQCHSYSVIFSFQEGHVDDKEEGDDDDDDDGGGSGCRRVCTALGGS